MVKHVEIAVIFTRIFIPKYKHARTTYLPGVNDMEFNMGIIVYDILHAAMDFAVYSLTRKYIGVEWRCHAPNKNAIVQFVCEMQS